MNDAPFLAYHSTEVLCVKENEGQSEALSTTSFNNKVSSRGATDYPSVLTLLQEVNNVNRKNNSENETKNNSENETKNNSENDNNVLNQDRDSNISNSYT